MNEVYTIHDHRHRFAAWAASRAASVIGCRFSVESGQKLLKISGVQQVSRSPEDLPSAEAFDGEHRKWREAIRAAAGDNIRMSHGVAAKLINVYQKSILICGGFQEHVKARSIHPPIDSLLLDALEENDVGNKRDIWKQYANIRWSKLESDQYEALITEIRAVCAGGGMWMIEEHWPGFR